MQRIPMQQKSGGPSIKKLAEAGRLCEDQPSDNFTPKKAKQMLKDDSAHGKPLTPAQKGMLGAAAGRDKK